ncbi:MAG: transcription antitermination factor NusB [Deltaproteobacteria bacterium]|nr:transcription antitermination factor NusB [Deltaproteobacteria bacterium]
MVLYGLEYSGQSAEGGIERFFLDIQDEPDLDPPPEWHDGPHAPFSIDPGARAYAAELVHGVTANQEELDRAISAISKNWRLERMARVDRMALRIGAFELLKCPDVPRKVAIDEAIELAKTFGTRESGAFVNGILDRLGEPEASEG